MDVEVLKLDDDIVEEIKSELTESGNLQSTTLGTWVVGYLPRR
jgi:hypothetical protein